MKTFFLWLTIVGIGFASLSGSYHSYLTKHPRNILVILDTSNSMQSNWEKVPQALEEIGRKSYARFSVITEKRRIHGWSQRLNLPKFSPYAPRNFAKLTGSKNYSEMEDATETYLITNTDDFQVQLPGDWNIVKLSR